MYENSKKPKRRLTSDLETPVVVEFVLIAPVVDTVLEMVERVLEVVLEVEVVVLLGPVVMPGMHLPGISLESGREGQGRSVRGVVTLDELAFGAERRLRSGDAQVLAAVVRRGRALGWRARLSDLCLEYTPVATAHPLHAVAALCEQMSRGGLQRGTKQNQAYRGTRVRRAGPRSRRSRSARCSSRACGASSPLCCGCVSA